MFLNRLGEHIAVMNRLVDFAERVEIISDLIVKALNSGGKVMFCGNGGSAADSQHLAAEFVGRFVDDRPPLAAIALSTDTSALTCIGNDYGFDHVFERQVTGIGRPGDILLAISTSGNSRNVIRAVKSAQKMGITSIGFLGRDGGELASLVEFPLVVPSQCTAHIQEAHIFLGHCLCEIIEKKLGFVK